MLPITYYFLKVIICSGILFGYYFFVLRNKRFHQHNRFYLLSVALFSWFIPLLKIEFWKEDAPIVAVPLNLLTVISSTDAIVAETIKTSRMTIDIEFVSLLLFSIVSSIIFASLLAGLYKIYRLIKSHPKEIWQNITIIFADTDQSPFSFFKYIFWNRNIDIENEDGKNILRHELTHVHERHSIDKLFINILLIIGWLNPFFWLIKKELNIIHEFIADSKSVSNGDVSAFAIMLLSSTYPQHSFSLTNSFFHSPIKRRLTMLTNFSKPKYSYLRRLLVLPLVTIVVILFAFKNKQQDKVKKQDAGIHVSYPAITRVEQTNDKLAHMPVNTNVEGENQTIIQEGKSTENRAITDTFSAKKPLVVIDGKEPITYIEFEKMDTKLMPDQILSINVLKGDAAIKKYGQKGLDGIIEITTKPIVSEKLEPEFARVFTRVENPPYFAEGMVAFAKIIEANMKYPKEAFDHKVEGAVTVQFIVDENGGLSHFKALSIKGYGLEEEAIRLIKLVGKWKPGIQNGRAVPVQVEQQIIFKLVGKSNVISNGQSALNNASIHLQWPIEKGEIQIPFGKYPIPGTKMIATSDGITFATPIGTPVKSAADGIITTVFNFGDVLAVLIKHDGYYTTYANLSKVSVSRGEKINSGTVLGFIAANEKGTGELQFILSDINGRFSDPEKFLVKR